MFLLKLSDVSWKLLRTSPRSSQYSSQKLSGLFHWTFIRISQWSFSPKHLWTICSSFWNSFLMFVKLFYRSLFKTFRNCFQMFSNPFLKFTKLFTFHLISRQSSLHFLKLFYEVLGTPLRSSSNSFLKCPQFIPVVLKQEFLESRREFFPDNLGTPTWSSRNPSLKFMKLFLEVFNTLLWTARSSSL